MSGGGGGRVGREGVEVVTGQPAGKDGLVYVTRGTPKGSGPVFPVFPLLLHVPRLPCECVGVCNVRNVCVCVGVCVCGCVCTCAVEVSVCERERERIKSV